MLQQRSQLLRPSVHQFCESPVSPLIVCTHQSNQTIYYQRAPAAAAEGEGEDDLWATNYGDM